MMNEVTSTNLSNLFDCRRWWKYRAHSSACQNKPETLDEVTDKLGSRTEGLIDFWLLEGKQLGQ